ncbi:MAG: dephospho-CoA kinase [Lentisphaeria bacterium]|nr:dephospho-CoA kinase [Lentisphaeria bacterium]
MILGITGAIGCGKSTVLRIFAENNWRIFDADKLCHQLYDGHDRELCARITELWGKDLILSDGSICRKALGKIVFSDKKQLDILTGLLYPALRRDLLDAAEKCRQEKVNAAFELPLLYEGGFEKSFDKILAIWSSPEIRHKRLQEKRSMNIDDILAREKQQLAPDEKLERADFAIINNGTEEELKSQLNCFFEYLGKEQK